MKRNAPMLMMIRFERGGGKRLLQLPPRQAPSSSHPANYQSIDAAEATCVP
jgi:hypothetical protein